MRSVALLGDDGSASDADQTVEVGIFMRALVFVVVCALVLTLCGCAGLPGVSSAPSTGSTVPGTTGADAVTTAVGETTADPALSTGQRSPTQAAVPAPSPSEKSLAYARSIGGTSHEGEKLYFIIGDSVGTENEAQSLLDEAIPKFGDMQSYFIVQRSDGFAGMRPGWWVIVEAHRESPSAEDRQFAKRGFPGAYVKQATVRASDPIPVYEDLVPQ